MSSKKTLTLNEYTKLIENIALLEGYSPSLVAKNAFDIELRWQDGATVEQCYAEVF